MFGPACHAAIPARPLTTPSVVWDRRQMGPEASRPAGARNNSLEHRAPQRATIRSACRCHGAHMKDTGVPHDRVDDLRRRGIRERARPWRQPITRCPRQRPFTFQWRNKHAHSTKRISAAQPNPPSARRPLPHRGRESDATELTNPHRHSRRCGHPAVSARMTENGTVADFPPPILLPTPTASHHVARPGLAGPLGPGPVVELGSADPATAHHSHGHAGDTGLDERQGEESVRHDLGISIVRSVDGQK
jgi:hypothetical protein